MSKELDTIANTSCCDRSIKHTCHGQILHYGDPSSTLIFKPWWNSLGYSRSSTVYPSEDNAVVFFRNTCFELLLLLMEKAAGPSVGQVDGCDCTAPLAETEVTTTGIAETCIHCTYISRSSYTLLLPVYCKSFFVKPKIATWEMLANLKSQHLLIVKVTKVSHALVSLLPLNRKLLHLQYV